MKLLRNYNGQSLLEVTIMIGVVALVGSGLAFVTLTSLRNSQFSKNQVQATKLAQEGISQVRAIRDRHYTVCKNANPPLNQWNASFWSSLPCPAPVGPATPVCLFTLQNTPKTVNCSGISTSVTDPAWLYEYQANQDIVNSIFSRKVIITDIDANQKKVEVTVSWNDASGTHKSDLFTILTNIVQ